MYQSVVPARDLNEAWWKCIRECLEHGYEYAITRGSGSSEGVWRKELDSVVVQITNPGTRPLAPDTPEGVPAPSSEEYIARYLPYLLSSEKQPNEVYTYGEYLEDQYLAVIEMYKKGGFETNQACMTVGDKESIKLDDPPCLRVIDTRIRYGKLHWFVYFRSWDLWAGFPTNLGGLQLIKEGMAKELGVEDGEMFAFSKGLHLYKDAWEYAKVVARF